MEYCIWNLSEIDDERSAGNRKIIDFNMLSDIEAIMEPFDIFPDTVFCEMRRFVSLTNENYDKLLT